MTLFLRQKWIINLLHTLYFCNCSSRDVVSEIRNSAPSCDSMLLILSRTASIVLRNCFGGPDSSAAVSCFCLSSRVACAFVQRSSSRFTPDWRCGVCLSSLLRFRDSSRTLIMETSLTVISSSFIYSGTVYVNINAHVSLVGFLATQHGWV